MPVKKSIYLLAIAASTLSFTSCTKNSDTAGPAGATGPAGPAGPSYTGAIDGHVSLFDQYGSRVLTGLQNVTLSFGSASVTVDSNGYYVKGGVKTGTYSINASNTGYGTTHINSFQFLSDTLNRDVKLSAIPNFAPATLTVTPVTLGDSIALTFTADSRQRNCIVFVNKGAAAGSTPDKYLLVYTKAIQPNVPRPTTIIIPAQDLINAGFTSGQTVNVTAYGYVVNDASAYEDLSTGKIVYTAVSATSQTATFTAP